MGWCAYCGKPLRPRPSKMGMAPRYCNHGCRQRAYELRKLDRAIKEAVSAERLREAG